MKLSYNLTKDDIPLFIFNTKFKLTLSDFDLYFLRFLKTIIFTLIIIVILYFVNNIIFFIFWIILTLFIFFYWSFCLVNYINLKSYNYFDNNKIEINIIGDNIIYNSNKYESNYNLYSFYWFNIKNDKLSLLTSNNWALTIYLSKLTDSQREELILIISSNKKIIKKPQSWGF